MENNKNSVIREQIERLQQRLNRFTRAVEKRQRELYEELEADEGINHETDMLMNSQWNAENLEKIDKNLNKPI
jgi:Arc/MetJ-type ribon-helix-helix transcriptional regulator